MRKLIECLFILFLVQLIGSSSLSASDYIVYDVFSNKEFKFVSKYKEVQSVQLNLSVEVDVSYFGFDSSTSVVKNRINSSIGRLALIEWTTENGSQRIRNELKQRVSNYLELINSSRQYRNGYYREKFEYSPSIKSIECKPISVYKDYLIFKLDFEFDLNGNQDYFDDELVISYYYKVNLISGEILIVSNKLNQSQLDLISSRLSEKFNDKYLLQTTKLNQEELIDYNDNENDEGINLINAKGKICKNICEKIDFSEADFIWFGWGVAINFQDFTRSSNIYNGESFGLFLPFNECYLIADILLDFKFATQLNKPNTAVKDFNYYSLIKKFSDLNSIPPIEDLVLIQTSHTKKVKTVSIESYQLFDNDRKNFRGVFVYDFDTLGNLICKSRMNEKEKRTELEVFNYSSLGILKSKQNIENKSMEFYTYDRNRNLIEKSIQNRNGIADTRFLYNENFIYYIEESSRDFVSLDNVKKIKIGNDEICLWNNCYSLDKSLNPLGIKSTINRYEQFQIGHDEKGRVVETHRDYDRYHNYFNYDSLDRFVSFQTYDSQNPTMIIEYFYNENDPYPYKQIKTSIQSGTIEMEKYSYEYFN